MTEYKAKKKIVFNVSTQYRLYIFPVTEGWLYVFGMEYQSPKEGSPGFFFSSKVTTANRLGHIKF